MSPLLCLSLLVFFSLACCLSPQPVSRRAPSREFSVSASALLMLSLTISLLSLSLLLVVWALTNHDYTNTCVVDECVCSDEGGSGPAELGRAGRCAPCTLWWAHLWTEARGLQLAIPDPGDGHSLHTPRPCLCPPAGDWLGSGWL